MRLEWNCDVKNEGSQNRRLAAIVFVMILLFSTLASAQFAIQAEPEQNAQAGGQTLWQTIKNGGYTMVAIGVLSIVALGLIINYFLTLQVSRLIPKELLRKIYALINENNFQDAITICETVGGFIPTVVAEGLKRRGRDRESILQAMEATGRREADYLRQKVRYLLDVSTMAPLLGLLGTVFGMIQAFNVVALDPAIVKPILLAQAVSKALVTTAAGLVIAIFAMVFYVYFRGRVLWIIGMMEDISEEFAERITESYQRSRGAAWDEEAH